MRIAGSPAKLSQFPAAHQFATHIEDLHQLGYRGQGVTIAVVDSGAFMDDPVTRAAVIGGINLSGEGAPDDLQDRLGHGGWVIRTILAMAPAAQIYVVRIFGSKPECGDYLAGQGLMHAAEHGDLTNASIGSDALHPAVEGAIRRHQALGKPLIAAAGNAGDGKAETTERHWPAADDYCTAVAAWDRSGLADSALEWLPPEPSGYSCSFPEVDLTALGRIPNLWEDGTSFAAPVIAGASAVFNSMCAATGRPWNDAINYTMLTTNTRQLSGLPARNDQTGYGLFTCRPWNPELRLEIDVKTRQAFLNNQPVDIGAVENRAPGGLYGYLRDVFEGVKGEGSVGYDEARGRAWYKF